MMHDEPIPQQKISQSLSPSESRPARLSHLFPGKLLTIIICVQIQLCSLVLLVWYQMVM